MSEKENGVRNWDFACAAGDADILINPLPQAD